MTGKKVTAENAESAEMIWVNALPRTTSAFSACSAVNNARLCDPRLRERLQTRGH